jgi:hypothetical protein
LSDAKVSIRLDEREVYVLPDRRSCTLHDLREAFQAIVEATLEVEPPLVPERDFQELLPLEW